MFGVTLISFCTPAVPKILDLVQPMNESRSRIVLYQTEFFIDQDKYYVELLFHSYVAVTIGVGYIVFFDNLFATFINHTCGMFEILKLHLETLSIKNLRSREDAVKNAEVIMKKFSRCSEMQTEIFKFVKNLESSYNIALLVVVGVNIVTILLTGMTAIIKKSQPSEMIRMAFISAGGICHLFWISWLGHALEVQSEKIFTSAYQSQWYCLPRHLQSMLLPIMMRSLTPCHLTAGKFYIMSMESFGKAMKMMMSSFTVLNSLR